MGFIVLMSDRDKEIKRMKKIFVVHMYNTSYSLYGGLAAFSTKEAADEYAKSCADKLEKSLRTQFQTNLDKGHVSIQRVGNTILAKMNLTDSCIFRSSYLVDELPLDDMGWKPAAESNKPNKYNTTKKNDKYTKAGPAIVTSNTTSTK
jgi:hypothetical protein